MEEDIKAKQVSNETEAIVDSLIEKYIELTRKDD